jgi:hypothetical protein
MGNRGGCIHDDNKQLKKRRWTSQRWIICVLDFKGRQRTLMSPGLYTELFFLDETTALAAGHRPCYECRRSDALKFRAALEAGGSVPASESVTEIDRLIAGDIQAILKRKVTRPQVDPHDLPDGAFYAVGDTAFLKHGAQAIPWSFAGYSPPVTLHRKATRLTPAPSCAALAAGYVPHIHASAAQYVESNPS